MDIGRKVGLRRRVLARLGDVQGAAYVPFCGDGDLTAALESYGGRDVWAADVDAACVDVMSGRFPAAHVAVADCDRWPFSGCDVTFAVADFDAYTYPYASFRSWWTSARRTDRLAVWFTDGQPQAIKRTSVYKAPDGAKVRFAGKAEMRQTYNAYWARVIRPWFAEYVAADGYAVEHAEKYLRGGTMLYWGAVLAKSTLPVEESGQADRVRQVEDALFEAAVSGNVPAILAWRAGNGGGRSAMTLADELNALMEDGEDAADSETVRDAAASQP